MKLKAQEFAKCVPATVELQDRTASTAAAVEQCYKKKSDTVERVTGVDYPPQVQFSA
jgi:hypothetical protein